MSGNDNCHDNAAVETFYKTIKEMLFNGACGRHADRLRQLPSHTSTASISRAVSTQHWKAKSSHLQMTGSLNEHSKRHQTATGPHPESSGRNAGVKRKESFALLAALGKCWPGQMNHPLAVKRVVTQAKPK